MNPISTRMPVIAERVGSESEGATRAAATQNTTASGRRPTKVHVTSRSFLRLARVNGREPLARRERAATTMAPSRKAHGGAVANLNFGHGSAGLRALPATRRG